MGDTTYSPAVHTLQAPRLTRTLVGPGFIREHRIGSLLRTTATIYCSNFWPLFLCYFLPTFSTVALQHLGASYDMQGLALGALLLNLPLSFLATAAITVTISDICLGNAPSLSRSYARLLKNRLWLRMLWTSIVQTSLIVLGLVMLVVPGLILLVRLLFTASIMVIERPPGLGALARSMAITKGAFWRLAGIISLLLVFMFGAFVVVLTIVGVAPAALPLLGADTHLVLTITVVLTQACLLGILYPFFFIAQILLYYDLRVRKEAYDPTLLAEDMMR